MQTIKTKIKNRNGERIAVLTEVHENQKGLAFVMHGLGGFKEQDHIRVFVEAFQEKGFTTVRFDTTNTLGESDGSYENATITNYYKDLDGVINWASGQSWYEELFWLSGHSLGGICTALFAEKYPEKVKGLAPISPVVSGELSFKAHEESSPEEFKKWKRTGYLIKKSNSKPGTVKKLKWSHMEDRLKYDLIPGADNLTMPVLLIVGEEDETTPPKHVGQLYKALPGPKEYHVIKNAPHTFRDQKHLEEIKMLMSEWIENYS